MAEQVNELMSEVVKTRSGKTRDPKHLSHESLTLLITADRLHALEQDSRKELKELRDRHQKVVFLHKLIKTINSMTDSNHEFDWSKTPELSEMFTKAKEYGVELDETKTKYSKEERDRLLENARMTVEDLNSLNELQLQTITRLTNERYESYQMARSIVKPLDDAKKAHARGIASAR